MKKQNSVQLRRPPQELLSFALKPSSYNEGSMLLGGRSADGEFQIAAQHHGAGNLAEAERVCRKILALAPRHADSLHLCGVVAAQMGQLDAAADFMSQAIDANPRVALYYKNLANAMKDAGQPEKAIDVLRKCLRAYPSDAEAHFHLGTLLGPAGDVEQAIVSFKQAVRHQPKYAEAWNKLGMALVLQLQIDEGIEAFRKSIRLDPKGATWGNLASALSVKGNYDEAIRAYRTAIRIGPEAAEIWCNFGRTLQEVGSFKEAIEAYETAIRIKPDREYAHWNISQVLLMQGDFQRGWAEYEWRWRLKDFKSPKCNVPQPQWFGEDLNGKTILLHLEQGRGDVIQFMRYTPMLIERGAQVIVYCRDEMARLLKSVTGVTRMTLGAETVAFDYYVPLLSLPLAMGTTLETVPANVPYLHAEPELAQAWAERLAPAANTLKVGLVWAGSSTHPNDKARSLTLSQFAPLAGMPGVTFYSLQKGTSAAATSLPPAGLELVDYTADLPDFADTAAMISQLDLVITVDTAVAHLAGAMGKKVWVMLPFVPDWRWMLDREDSPWYPTMRLFRQKKIGDWAGVMEKVAEALRHAVSARNC